MAYTVNVLEHVKPYDDLVVPAADTGAVLYPDQSWTTAELPPYAIWAARLSDDQSAYRKTGTSGYTAAEIHAAGLTGLD